MRTKAFTILLLGIYLTPVKSPIYADLEQISAETLEDRQDIHVSEITINQEHGGTFILSNNQSFQFYIKHPHRTNKEYLEIKYSLGNSEFDCDIICTFNIPDDFQKRSSELKEYLNTCLLSEVDAAQKIHLMILIKGDGSKTELDIPSNIPTELIGVNNLQNFKNVIKTVSHNPYDVYRLGEKLGEIPHGVVKVYLETC